MERSVKWPYGKRCSGCERKLPDPRGKWCAICKLRVRRIQQRAIWAKFKGRRKLGPLQPKLTYRGKPTKWALANPDRALELQAIRGSGSVEGLLLR